MIKCNIKLHFSYCIDNLDFSYLSHNGKFASLFKLYTFFPI